MKNKIEIGKRIVALLLFLLICFCICSCEESTDEKAERSRRSAEQLGNQVSEQQERINDFQIDWDNYKKLESESNALR